MSRCCKQRSQPGLEGCIASGLRAAARDDHHEILALEPSPSLHGTVRQPRPEAGTLTHRTGVA